MENKETFNLDRGIVFKDKEENVTLIFNPRGSYVMTTISDYENIYKDMDDNTAEIVEVVFDDDNPNSDLEFGTPYGLKSLRRISFIGNHANEILENLYNKKNDLDLFKIMFDKELPDILDETQNPKFKKENRGLIFKTSKGKFKLIFTLKDDDGVIKYYDRIVPDNEGQMQKTITDKDCLVVKLFCRNEFRGDMDIDVSGVGITKLKGEKTAEEIIMKKYKRDRKSLLDLMYEDVIN